MEPASTLLAASTSSRRRFDLFAQLAVADGTIEGQGERLDLDGLVRKS
jgi:hypothetical protein